MRTISRLSGLLAAGLMLTTAGPGLAQSSQSAGDISEIRIGNTMSYSGPASSYGVSGQMMQAVFARVNAAGGVNGRQVNFLSYDDAYNPARTLEQTRRLVEQDNVLFMAGPVGSAHNIAIQRYLNQREIPHLLVLAGGERWNDPETYPWTTGGLASPYELEGFAFGQHLIGENPAARIAVLYQNDDFGREYMDGLERGIAGSDARILRRESYEIMDPSVEAQIVALRATDADALMLFATPRAVAQSIRKAADLGWQPLRYMGNQASVIQTSLEPAGLDISVGVITAINQYDVNDPAFMQTEAHAAYLATIRDYLPGADPANGSVMNGYNTAHAILAILEGAGDDLSRANIMDVARNLTELRLPLVLEHIPLGTEPDNHQLVRGVQLARFNGRSYDLFGDLVRY